MNARQKCKKLKKELENLKTFPVCTKYNVLPVQNFSVSTVRNKDYFRYIDESRIQDIISNSLSHSIMDGIRSSLIINRIDDMDSGNIIYETTIGVVFYD